MLNLSLDGPWTFRQADPLAPTHPATVPGSIYTDLLRAGLIEDPFWRDRETSLQWIGKAAWLYARTFAVTSELLAQDKIILHADGLDTLAEIRLNGHFIAYADNQHITWEWDIKALLHPGENLLEIRFDPPDAFLAEKAKINPLPAWNEFGGYQHRGWLRKAHSNFGWDWGPVLVSCGIWRSLSVLAFSGARLADVNPTQHHAPDGSVTLDVCIQLEITDSSVHHAELELTLDGKLIASARVTFATSASSAPQATATLTIPQPELWWPNDLGAHPLYTLTVRLLDAADDELDQWQRRLGLRRLDLARRPDAWGESFQFECNGTPFFAKGSNWAPPLPYANWPEGDGWKTLLRDAAAAHMNMIRVWGGAYFPPDAFFDLCDELGLTVWQDFPFACGPYPGFDPHFLASIEREARDNIRRLRHHACLALWCGNNEVEPTFVGPERKEAKEGQMSVADYDKIFHDVLPAAVSALSPQVAYWPASPAHPTRDRSVFAWPFAPDAGDTHIWEIWFSDSPFENYRNYSNRFVSEFGFQSFPHPQTIAAYTRPDERQLNSPVMEFHQRSAPGNKQMIKFILEWFRFPEKRDDLIHLTQLIQALAVKTGVEHWRRKVPQTMGALYWQLNDTWPCPSWSSIDFFGRWKALHHFAARFFAPVLVTGLEDLAAGTVAIHLANDRRTPTSGIARARITDLDGVLLRHEQWPATLPPGTNVHVGTLELQAELKSHGPSALLVWLDFSESADSTIPPAPGTLVLFARPKTFALRPAGLSVTVTRHGEKSFLVTVRATQPAFWVWLDTGAHTTRFSDNYRCLHPDDIWQVIATPAPPLGAEEFTRHLAVRDLQSTYA